MPANIVATLVNFALNFAYLAKLGADRQARGGAEDAARYNRDLMRTYRRIADELPTVAERTDFLDPVGVYLSFNSAGPSSARTTAFGKVFDEMRRLRRAADLSDARATARVAIEEARRQRRLRTKMEVDS